MSAPASSPDSFRPRRTAQGTIVGMPPVMREPAALGQLCSTTLRSVYRPAAEDVAPCSDAFHPERWSNPPPTGLAPIVPCDEPDDDDRALIRSKLELTPLPLAARPAPALEPEPEPPTQRWAPAPRPVADDPVVLPLERGRSLWIVAAVPVAFLVLALLLALR